MLTSVLLLLLGLVTLVIGAEALVRGASRLALALGISPLVVGLTVVALGTSSPEVAVSVGAVMTGNTDIAIGNVVGSNILNVLLVLGVSAVIAPLVVHSQLIRQEVPIMIGTTLLLVAMLFDARLGRLEGALLVCLLVAYVAFLVLQSRAAGAKVRAEYSEAVARRAGWRDHWVVQVTLVLAGLGLLVLGAEWLVEAGVAIARALGVSDLIIGLTIIAVGTSTPEIAASIMAAVRGERDIAVGNVIGSNIFNILGCLGIAGVAAPQGLAVSRAVLNFDLWVMLAVTVACLPVFIAGRVIGRGKGALFLGYYVAYLAYLVLGSQHHDMLDEYSMIMMSFVVPLTIVTLVAMLVREQHRRGASRGRGSE